MISIPPDHKVHEDDVLEHDQNALKDAEYLNSHEVVQGRSYLVRLDVQQVDPESWVRAIIGIHV